MRSLEERQCVESEREQLIVELRDDRALMMEMLAVGYRQPEFRALVLGWADRMRRAVELLESERRPVRAERAEVVVEEVRAVLAPYMSGPVVSTHPALQEAWAVIERDPIEARPEVELG